MKEPSRQKPRQKMHRAAPHRFPPCFCSDSVSVELCGLNTHSLEQYLLWTSLSTDLYFGDHRFMYSHNLRLHHPGVTGVSVETILAPTCVSLLKSTRVEVILSGRSNGVYRTRQPLSLCLSGGVKLNLVAKLHQSPNTMRN